MLDQTKFPPNITKREYKRLMVQLRDRLYQAHRKGRSKRIPVILLFEGWDTAGKTTTIQELASVLDPRYYKNHPIRAARTFELRRPWLYRFWVKIPRRGEWALFDRSWYGRVLVERVNQLTEEANWQRGYQEINEFEKQLADDGYVILKFFFHITKKMQRSRFLKLIDNPITAWHIQADDWDQHAKYDMYVKAVEEMLEKTNTPYAPWHVIGTSHKRTTRYKTFKTIINTLETKISKTSK